MAAQFKSNVRRREEKGVGSVSMKRLIGCGVGAVLGFMLLRLTVLAHVALPLLVVLFAGLLIVTGSRGGLPRWQRWWLGVRGRLTLAAARRPDSWWASIARLLDIDTRIAHLHHNILFEQGQETPHADWREWVVYADLTEAETNGGLRFLGEEAAHGEPL